MILLTEIVNATFANRNCDFQAHDITEAELTQRLLDAGWRKTQVETFYYKGQIIAAPDDQSYIVPRTFEDETFWWGHVLDVDIFAEIMEGVEVSLMEEVDDLEGDEWEDDEVEEEGEDDA